MRVLKVEYLADYKLKITFSDRKIKVVDLEEEIKNAKGVFLPLKDLDYFKQVALDDCHLSICWPNGADICPDLLYATGRPIQMEKRTKRMLKRKNIRRPKSRGKLTKT